MEEDGVGVVKGHVLVLCSPLRGHINPAMELARKLTHHGFLVTFPFSHYMATKTHLQEVAPKGEKLNIGGERGKEKDKEGEREEEKVDFGGERDKEKDKEGEREEEKVEIEGEDEVKGGEREKEKVNIKGGREEEKLKIGGERENGSGEKLDIEGKITRENRLGEEEIEEEKEMHGKRENGGEKESGGKRENGGEEVVIKEGKRENIRGGEAEGKRENGSGGEESGGKKDNGGEEVVIKEGKREKDQQEEKRREKMIRRLVVADGLPEDYPREARYKESMEALQAPVEEALMRIMGSDDDHAWPPMQCVICDVFVTWGCDLAAKLNLPFFALFTSNATACTVLSSAQDLLTKGVIPFKAKERSLEGQIINIRGVMPLHPSDFPPSMQTQDPSNPRFQYTLHMFAHLHQAKALFLNTIYELETTLIDNLRRTLPVYTVGPLSTLESTTSIKDKDDHHICLNWLNEKPKSSVIYVSFGSLLALSEAQIREMALGLEGSEYAFIWAIRSDTLKRSLSAILPEGFMERNKSRCLIISWAPQLLVLSHPAIAAFFSHCGWNSVLENITIGGVPMLCLPDVAEQKINCRIIVDQWKIGVEVQRRKCDGLVTNEEIERATKSLLHGREGDQRRAQASLLRTQARNAILKGRSSFTNLLSFVHSFSNLA